MIASQITGVRGALTDPGRGWIRFPRCVGAPTLVALARRGGHPWRPLAPQVGVVEQEGWYCQPPFDGLPSPARRFADALAALLAVELAHLDVPARFNEITWQRHVPGAVAIGAHRDQSFYTGVIAIVTLCGTARFSVLARRDPRRLLAGWETKPGDLVLLRGTGLGDQGARCPWHEVDAPTSGERVTLTLRHTTRTPGGWE